MVSMPGNVIIRAGLPFESRCFDHYWHTQFQVFEDFLDFLAHSSHIIIIYNNL